MWDCWGGLNELALELRWFMPAEGEGSGGVCKGLVSPRDIWLLLSQGFTEITELGLGLGLGLDRCRLEKSLTVKLRRIN